MGSVSIFNANSGSAGVLRLSSNIRPCFNFKVGSRGNANGTTVVTDFAIRKAENISVTPTLGTQLFLYTGGESAWEIEITGLALKTCNSGSHGFNDIIDWYNSQNVRKTGKPVKLVFGNKVYKAYLYKFEIQSQYKLLNAFSFKATFTGVLK